MALIRPIPKKFNFDSTFTIQTSNSLSVEVGSTYVLSLLVSHGASAPTLSGCNINIPLTIRGTVTDSWDQYLTVVTATSSTISASGLLSVSGFAYARIA